MALDSLAGGDEEVDQDVGATDQRGDERHQTPDLPRPARCGLELCEPMAQTMAAMTSPATQAMSPTVNNAPTMLDRVLIPGRPVLLGSTSATTSTHLPRRR